MKKSFLTRRTERNEISPGGIWGLVGYEDYKNVRVFAPVPLNFLRAFGRWVWPWIAWRWSLWFDEHPLPVGESAGVTTKVLKPVFHNGPDRDFGVISIEYAPDDKRSQALANLRAWEREAWNQVDDYIFQLGSGELPPDAIFKFDRSKLVLPYPAIMETMP